MAVHVVYLPRSQPSGVGWCGPACLANALVIYGIPTSQEECAGACQCPLPDEGTTPSEMKRGIKQFGFSGYLKEFTSKAKSDTAFTWLRKQTDNGRLVFCRINGHYENAHWILVLRVTSRGIQVWDPHEEGSKLVSKRNLLKAWWNVTSPKDPSRDIPSSITLLAMSPRSKLARRAVIVRANLLDPPKGKLPTEKDVPESFEPGTEPTNELQG